MKPDANGVFVIAGENEQGKSSVLAALAGALGGRAYKPDMPVRKGADFAEVIAETEDIVITAKWTEKSYKVVVENRDGSRHRAAQSVLDSFYTSFTLDPEEFTRLKDKEKVETLRRLTGINTGAIDQERAELFEDRTNVNREAKIYQTQAAGMKVVPKPDGEIEAEVSVVELSKKKSEAMTIQSENARLRKLADNQRDHVAALVNVVRLKEQYIAKIRKQLEEELATLKRQEDDVLRERAIFITALESADNAQNNALGVDTTDLDRQMDEAAAKNKIRANKLFQLAEHTRSAKLLDAAQKQANDKTAESERLTRAIDDLDERKKKLFDEAKLPVPGLTFNDDGVFVNGIPFSQISSSEQIRLGLAMAMATKPKLRLILIKSGDLLGVPKLQAVQDWAHANDMLVLVERRQKDGAVGIVLEEGRLKE